MEDCKDARYRTTWGHPVVSFLCILLSAEDTPKKTVQTHLINILPLQLLDQLLQPLLISLHPTRLKEGLDVPCGRGGVTAQLEEEVGCDVLHCWARWAVGWWLVVGWLVGGWWVDGLVNRIKLCMSSRYT
jgi:hypothetical protein